MRLKDLYPPHKGRYDFPERRADDDTERSGTRRASDD